MPTFFPYWETALFMKSVANNGINIFFSFSKLIGYGAPFKSKGLSDIFHVLSLFSWK
jgi:hypothetical protein